MAGRAVTSEPPAGPHPAEPRKSRSRWRNAALVVLALIVILAAARAALPWAVHWYVSRTIDRDPIYDGVVEDIDLHLWRGAYSIEGVRLNKMTGSVPVPLFAAERVDLAIQWSALWHGEAVGRIRFERAELNFVDAEDESEQQTGAGGPWLQIIRDLFPFKINRAEIRDGAVHFHAFHKDPPVDLRLTQVHGTIDNLSNIREETAPLIATVRARAVAMDHAKVEYLMKLDPFSYRPTFELAVKLTGLDVTKINDLARAYGGFDFERGWFDLVIEIESTEGRVEGYLKPLFRDIKVLSLRQDLAEENILALFWEAMVGVVSEIFQNYPRDQFATRIPVSGDLAAPQTSVLEIIGNVLRNAFIRAYLPNFEGADPQAQGLEFGPASVLDPGAQ